MASRSLIFRPNRCVAMVLSTYFSTWAISSILIRRFSCPVMGKTKCSSRCANKLRCTVLINHDILWFFHQGNSSRPTGSFHFLGGLGCCLVHCTFLSPPSSVIKG